MSAVPWWRRLTPRHLILLVPWLGIAIAASKPIQDNSFLWHVRAGTLQLDLGHVLTSDPFSFTMSGVAWRTQSWLVELGYGLLERWLGGLGWVRTELVLVTGITYLLVGVVIQKRSRNLLATGIFMAAFTWLVVAFEVPRPVLFSGLFLAMLIVLLDRDLLWPVPLLLWVWAGIHGSWILALGFVVLESIASKRRLKQALGLGTASLAAVTLTAQGWGTWGILLAFLRNRAALDYIQEWATPDILSIQIAPYVLVLFLLFVGSSRASHNLSQLWVVFPFAIFGLTAGRNLYPAMIVLLPYAASEWPRQWRWKERMVPRREAAINLVLAAALFLVPVGLLVTASGTVDAARFPVSASRYLVPGLAWHDDGTGGYLIYSAWPDREVFIDDRAELYGVQFMEEFIATSQGTPVWKDAFRSYDIRQALVAVGTGLDQALREAGWQSRYRDKQWAVWLAPQSPAWSPEAHNLPGLGIDRLVLASE